MRRGGGEAGHNAAIAASASLAGCGPSFLITPEGYRQVPAHGVMRNRRARERPPGSPAVLAQVIRNREAPVTGPQLA